MLKKILHKLLPTKREIMHNLKMRKTNFILQKSPPPLIKIMVHHSVSNKLLWEITGAYLWGDLDLHQ